MNAVILMLAVTACYTITSLSDKYAVAEAKFTANEFTFLMCSSMSVFLAVSLPFQEIRFSLTWQSFAAVALIAVCKMLEFQMSAYVLKQLSAFELKAWLGITLFASYFTDVFFGAELKMMKLVCITATAAGLIFIASSAKESKVDYKKIAIPLVLYLASKFGYGLVIKGFSPYVSSTMQLLPAMIIISLIMLSKVSAAEIFKKNRSGAVKVILARIPNTVGMLLENAIIAISLVNYSFIQPMILISLFVIGLIRKEKRSPLNLIGSIVCVLGVAGFQLV
ncbi:MAG: hypothetical protein ACI4J6_07390 [Oscillospiraceae bacterium]